MKLLLLDLKCRCHVSNYFQSLFVGKQGFKLGNITITFVFRGTDQRYEKRAGEIWNSNASI